MNDRVMTGLSYSYRRHLFSSARHYVLHTDTLEWRDEHREGRVVYREISKIHIFQERFLGSAATYWGCVLFPRAGAKIRLGAANRIGFRSIEDCTATYIPFIKELEARVRAANPNASFIARKHWLSHLEMLAGWIAVFCLRGSRHINPDRSGAFVAWCMRLLGPRLRGHRTARANLVAAFPEKSSAEIEKILVGMWDNLGRSLAEYACLDQLWDYDPVHPESGRILLDQTNAALYKRLGAERTPCLFFAAHLANWELPALAVEPGLGREGVMLYRPPKIAPLAEELYKIRTKCIGTVIPADAYTLFRLGEAIQRGAIVGILADQHYANGVDVVFFRRHCKVHPMVARLERTFDCPIYGARAIRLPDRRFRIEITQALDMPRDKRGKIDVAGTMQMITAIIEKWVREHPEQWMWLHRRWR